MTKPFEKATSPRYLTRIFVFLLVCQLLTGVFLLSVNHAKAAGTTYYVSNCGTIGNDSNNGTTTSTPWLTIAKVNGRSFSPGDSILFESGCTWREQLNPPSSGSAGNLIAFGAYGSGAVPI